MDNNNGPDQSAEFQRLRQESENLRRSIRRLARDNEHLEWRVERLEASIIFRSLRWLGSTFAALRFKFQPREDADHAARRKSDRDYATWVNETAVLDSLRTPQCGAQPRQVPTVSFLIDANHSNSNLLDRTISSVRAQSCIASELHVCSGGDFPQSIRKALETTQSEFVVLLGRGVILEPDAVQCWLEAMKDDTAAVYGDWDHISAAGQRHSPQFTPGLSSELLLRTMYWGRCYLVRASEIRNAAWPANDSTLPLEHDLALRLTEKRLPIVRVPRILWHLSDAAQGSDVNLDAIRLALDRRSEKASVAPTYSTKGSADIQRSPVSARASIVICSRNPKLLERCLASLRPTIDQRHELIVVAHRVVAAAAHRMDGRSDLKPVAAKYGARTIEYEGAFHFGLMNERGVSASSGSVLVLLNDDVQPLAADWLESMLSQAVRPDVGIVGALLLYPGGGVQHAGIVLGTSNVPAHAGRFARDCPYWSWLKITREVSAVTGACLAIRRAVWDELGGFDRHFPINYNDVDLCLRAGERGYRVILETRATLIHEESQTRTAIVRARERELFWERWQMLQDSADPFFNPQLVTPDETIRLREPSM